MNFRIKILLLLSAKGLLRRRTNEWSSGQLLLLRMGILLHYHFPRKGFKFYIKNDEDKRMS